MANDRSDFVQVRLTEAALAELGHSGDNPASVRVTTAHLHYRFLGTAPVEVLTSEWRNVLSRERFGAVHLLETVSHPALAGATENEVAR